MRHNGVVSSYTISTDFHGLMGDQRTPNFRVSQCQLLNILPNNLTFMYPLAYNLFVSIALQNDNDSLCFALMYIHFGS